MEIVKYCQSVFTCNFAIPSVQIAKISEKFVEKKLTLYMNVVLVYVTIYQLIFAVR